MLYERRGTPVLRSARPELVVPKPWTSRRWTEALNSRLWPRACAATGKRASMVAEPRPPVFRPLSWVVSVGSTKSRTSVERSEHKQNSTCHVKSQL